MKTPHKHRDLIIAWANGAEIEVRANGDGDWLSITSPTWYEAMEYRIKPEPKPDTTLYYNVTHQGGMVIAGTSKHSVYHPFNLILTFDGETGKLKDAKVL